MKSFMPLYGKQQAGTWIPPHTPINGITYNLWTFLTKSESIFHISRSNGHDVPLTVLGKHNGIDIHDRHSAFETLAGKTGNDQQYCWSQII